jgi:hypothetical protein
VPFDTQLTVFATIAGAVVAWAGAEVLQSRTLWTLAATLLAIHSAAAFAVFYGWSHDVALAATVRQTVAVTGVASASGIYVNYACLAVWTADVAWWWISPRSYRGRARMVSAAVHGFIFFMFLNGAVIFADGWMRTAGLVATATVALAWYRRWRRPSAPP